MYLKNSNFGFFEDECTVCVSYLILFLARSLELLAVLLAACCMLATWTFYIKATMVWQSLETCILKSSRSKAAGYDVHISGECFFNLAILVSATAST